jgi:hypothetical protein
MQNVSRVWLEVRAFNVHSVSNELLVPFCPLYMDQIFVLGLGLDTYQLLGITQQLNQVRQVGLELLKNGTEFYESMDL